MSNDQRPASDRPKTLRTPVILAGDMTTGLPLVSGVASLLYALGLSLVLPVSQMLPGWADTLNLVVTATLYVAPLGTGLAAFHALHLRRAQILDVASVAARGRSAPIVVALAAIVLWQWAALSAFLLVVSIRADTDGAFTWVMPLIVIPAYLLVLACACVGAAIGVHSRSYLAPPIGTLVVFVAIYAIALSSGPIHNFSPVLSEVFYQVFLEPDPRRIGAISVLLLGLALAATLVATASSWGATARRPLAVSVVLAVLVAGVVLSAVFGDEPVRLRQGGENVCASADGIDLCVWAESEQRLDPMVDALSEVRDAVAGAIPVPSSFHELGVEEPGTPGAVQVPMEGDPDFLIPAILAVVPAAGCETLEAQTASDELVQWIRSAVDPTNYPPNDVVGPVLEAPVNEQQEWAQSRFDLASRSCMSLDE